MSLSKKPNYHCHIIGTVKFVLLAWMTACGVIPSAELSADNVSLAGERHGFSGQEVATGAGAALPKQDPNVAPDSLPIEIPSLPEPGSGSIGACPPGSYPCTAWACCIGGPGLPRTHVDWRSIAANTSEIGVRQPTSPPPASCTTPYTWCDCTPYCGRGFCVHPACQNPSKDCRFICD